jgi:hypothetical protein
MQQRSGSCRVQPLVGRPFDERGSHRFRAIWTEETAFCDRRGLCKRGLKPTDAAPKRMFQRVGSASRLPRGRLLRSFEDLQADVDALIAYLDVRAGDELQNIVLGFVAERTAK